MALQSQTLRGASGSHSAMSMGRPRRVGSRRVVGWALLAAIVGGGFVYLIRHRDGGTGTAGGLGPQTARADDGVASGVVPPLKDPMGVPASSGVAASPAAPKSEPVVLEMGGRVRPGTAGSPSSTLPAFTSATAGIPATAQSTTGTPETSPATATPMVHDPLAAPGAGRMDTSGLPSELAAAQQQAERAIADKRLVEARALLNRILVDPRVGERERDGVRRWMSEVNRELVFSANLYPGDPLAEAYEVKKGDSFIKISRTVNSVTESGFIQRVNGVSPSALRIGQALKVVKGPFHAVVSKGAFRMDVYAGPAMAASSIGSSGLGAGAEPGWTYICSFPVGLGEKGVTPMGAFTVKDGSKLINPPWVNPRTGEKFDKDDPKNPIGERWIGLVGLDDKARTFTGYGIHGTVVPDSIGKEMSMGCVRMNSGDVEIVYELLMGRSSVVKIVP